MTLATAPPSSHVWLASLQTGALYHGYFSLKDSAGVRWYYHFLSSGDIDILAEPPVFGIDVTPDPDQTHLILDDPAAHAWYVLPSPGSGLLQVVFNAPAGTAWDLAAGLNSLTLFAATGNVYYILQMATGPVLEVISATGPGLEGTINQQALLRFSSGSIAPVFDDLFWDPVLLHPGQFTTSVLGNPDIVINDPAGITRFGTMEIATGDGANDTPLATTCAAGHEILLYDGADDDAFAAFTLRYRAVLRSIEYDLDTARFILTDKFRGLNIPLQTSTYGGTGGLEGGMDLEGQGKPITLGNVFNIPPVLVDTNGGSPVYQVHDGLCEAITVFDEGIQLNYGGDLADVYSWTPVGGQYVTDYQRGVFRLGVDPVGVLTAHVLAPITGCIDVIQQVVTTYAGLLDPDEIDTAAFSAMRAILNWIVGLYYVDPTTVRITDVLSTLCRSIASFWAFTPAGVFTLRTFGPGTAFLTPHVITDAQVLSFQKLPSPAVYWNIRVGQQRVYTVRALGDLDTLADEAYKTLVAKEYRYVSGSNPGILTACPDASTLDWPTALRNRVDAQTLLGMLQFRVGTPRQLYELELADNQFLHAVGDTPTVDLSRYGLASITPQILEITEDLGEETTRVILWG